MARAPRKSQLKMRKNNNNFIPLLHPFKFVLPPPMKAAKHSEPCTGPLCSSSR